MNYQNIKQSLILLVITLCISACNNQNVANQSNTNTAKPTQTNTPKEAIDSFVATKYPKWIIKGDTLDKGFSPENHESIQFDLHLSKDKEDKVITVILKKFQTADGSLYWLAYEPTKLEIAEISLQEVRKTAVEDFISNGDIYEFVNDPSDNSRERGYGY